MTSALVPASIELISKWISPREALYGVGAGSRARAAGPAAARGQAQHRGRGLPVCYKARWCRAIVPPARLHIQAMNHHARILGAVLGHVSNTCSWAPAAAAVYIDAADSSTIILAVKGRTVYDSRGGPTVEVEVTCVLPSPPLPPPPLLVPGI